MLKKIVLGNKMVEYELTRKKVKNINLRVRRDGTIAVSCSPRTSESRVEKFIRDNEDFILKALSHNEERASNSLRPVNYQTGEIVSVYGDKYVLRVEEGKKDNLVVGDSEIVICCRRPEMLESRAKIYERWRRMELQTKVLDMCDEVYPHFEKLGVKYPSAIKFRSMTSRWGSCKPKEGVLTFNYNLFETPDDAIYYVVVHEFAHFLEANHSNRFYAQVAAVLPDYQRRRQLLRDY